jgi:K+-sensing histidine kinase KdpD
MIGEILKDHAEKEREILLVDDDDSFLNVIQNILKAKGFSVDTAHQAEDALSRIEQNPYNLVILDLHLPDMDGLKMLSSIVRIQPDIVPIILTGYSSVENSVRSLNMGAFAYLEKPLNPENLIEVIRRGLEKQNLIQENRRLLKELGQRNRDLNILLSINQALSCSLKPKNIVDCALEITTKSLGIDGGYMFVMRDGDSTMIDYCGFNPKMVDRLKNIEFNNSDVVSSVFERTRPVIINHINGKADLLLSSLAQGGYKSYAAIPIVTANKTNGVLGIATLGEHAFSPMEVDLLKAIGGEIAVAITNSRLFEEASNARALRELDTMRTELLANVSHELRTPLAAIKGFASSLLQTDISFDNETRTSFIQTIDSEADRLNNLINDLLLMSKIEAGAFKLKLRCYEISEIVDSIKDRLYSIATKHNLRIIIPDKLPKLNVDGSRIGQVISNLVENAVKYSDEGSEIRIEVELQDKRIVTSVIDSGDGIPAENQEQIFHRFNQLNNTGHRKGSGLGLSISRGIVESHGGKIWVESAPGEGAKFRFSLPLE